MRDKVDSIKLTKKHKLYLVIIGVFIGLLSIITSNIIGDIAYNNILYLFGKFMLGVLGIALIMGPAIALWYRKPAKEERNGIIGIMIIGIIILIIAIYIWRFY
jgi:membrane protein DedA with SNARE-associated domain